MANWKIITGRLAMGWHMFDAAELVVEGGE